MIGRGRFADLWLVLAILTLLGIGLLSNFSTSHADGSGLYHFQRQLFWIGIGSAITIAILSIPLRFFEMAAYIFYGLSVTSLVLVLAVESEYTTM